MSFGWPSGSGGISEEGEGRRGPARQPSYRTAKGRHIGANGKRADHHLADPGAPPTTPLFVGWGAYSSSVSVVGDSSSARFPASVISKHTARDALAVLALAPLMRRVRRAVTRGGRGVAR